MVWTTPQQLTWLNNQLPAYIEAQKARRLAEFYRVVQKDWIEVFGEQSDPPDPNFPKRPPLEQRIAQWFNNHGRTKKEKSSPGEEDDASPQPKRRRRPRSAVPTSSKGKSRLSVEDMGTDSENRTPPLSSGHSRPPSFNEGYHFVTDNAAARVEGVNTDTFTGEMKEHTNEHSGLPGYLQEAAKRLPPEELRRYIENEELQRNIGKLDERLAQWTSQLQRDVRACGIFMVAAVEPKTGLVIQKIFEFDGSESGKLLKDWCQNDTWEKFTGTFADYARSNYSPDELRNRLLYQAKPAMVPPQVQLPTQPEYDSDSEDDHDRPVSYRLRHVDDQTLVDEQTRTVRLNGSMGRRGPVVQAAQLPLPNQNPSPTSPGSSTVCITPSSPEQHRNGHGQKRRDSVQLPPHSIHADRRDGMTVHEFNVEPLHGHEDVDAPMPYAGPNTGGTASASAITKGRHPPSFDVDNAAKNKDKWRSDSPFEDASDAAADQNAHPPWDTLPQSDNESESDVPDEETTQTHNSMAKPAGMSNGGLLHKVHHVTRDPNRHMNPPPKVNGHSPAHSHHSSVNGHSPAQLHKQVSNGTPHSVNGHVKSPILTSHFHTNGSKPNSHGNPKIQTHSKRNSLDMEGEPPDPNVANANRFPKRTKLVG